MPAPPHVTPPTVSMFKPGQSSSATESRPQQGLTGSTAAANSISSSLLDSGKTSGKPPISNPLEQSSNQQTRLEMVTKMISQYLESIHQVINFTPSY